MKKILLTLILVCSMLNAAITNAQTKTLTALSDRVPTQVISSATDDVWEDVKDVTLSLSANAKVLVEATIEIEVASGNSSILTQFKIIDNSTPIKESQIISRYVVEKVYNDIGIATVSFIFDYDGEAASEKKFTLQHAKSTPGKSKTFISRAIITAIEIESDNVALPNGQGTNLTANTLNTVYDQVAGTTLNLTSQADIYIVSTFSTSTTDNAESTGGWSLRESLDETTYTPIDNSQITRTILDDASIGSASIVTMINRPAGTYYLDLAHKVNAGTNINTSGATISAVVLTSTAGDVFASLSSLDASDDNATATYETIKTANTGPPSNVNPSDLFMHTSFNMTATGGDIAYATYKFNTTLIPSPFEIQRYVPNGKTGSGSLQGIVPGLVSGYDYPISFQHKDSGNSGYTLTTFNVNAIGFYLTSSPTFTWDGSTDSDWNTAANWDLGLVPSYADIVIIPDVTTNDPIINTANNGCFDLTIESGASLTVNAGAGLTILELLLLLITIQMPMKIISLLQMQQQSL